MSIPSYDPSKVRKYTASVPLRVCSKRCGWWSIDSTKDAKYCTNCGNILILADIKCPSCSKLTNRDNNYCEYCGNKL